MMTADCWSIAERAVDELDLDLSEQTLRRAQVTLQAAIRVSLDEDRPWARRVERLEPRIVSAIVRLRSPSRYVAAHANDPRRRGRTWEEARAHKRARHRTVREERMSAGLCTSCGRARDLGGVTCSACLHTDKAWRKSRAVREKTAEYLDDECQPLVLKFKPRLLPVIGPYYDCLRMDDCLTELIRACGRQDAPGSSCPEGCPDLVPHDRAAQMRHQAMSRDEMV